LGAAQEGEELLVAVKTPSNPLGESLTVQLLGAAGKVLAAETRPLEASALSAVHGFRLKVPGLDTARASVRWVLGSRIGQLPLPRVLLARGHETSVSGTGDFFPGTASCLRCEVHGVRSATETIPLPGARVSVRLVPPDGKARPLFVGTTGEDGAALATFEIPDLPDGVCSLEVESKSALG
jgi:hypothetical protein